ncbi:UDP-glucuronic acid decarboxylase 1 [Sphaceloma murrayae]|uniref:UDP-glucuronic acid decarboxylase 1 n=1 Tax=Sphaceloma murrayae TaxID=2082308 RepID=A0A2K1QK76_9PEZI|nr:UDP-glucuronic acid decarboxylase 1 [Sphaceloma murrayae]
MPFVEGPREAEPPLGVVSTWHDAPLLHGRSRFSDVGHKSIMITGAAGFIGSWVARHFTVMYPSYQIVCFDKLDYCATWNNIVQLTALPNFSFFKGDIREAEDVLECLERYQIDTVFHFAAQTHVDLSFGNSFEFTRNNVDGTHVMLECVRRYGKVNKFIHVSTDEVYGESRDDEDDLLETALLEPTNPYAASKAAAEMYVHAYQKSFKIPVIVVRSNNVYGPHQYPEKVIPKFILLLERGKPLTLHGSGKNTRRYLYAGDAADAYDTVLHRGEVGHIYNVGSRDEIGNMHLCKMLLKYFEHQGEEEERIEHVEDRPFNDHRYAVDGSRLRKLGWEQKTSFEDGLRITIDWYRKYGTEWWGDIESRLTPFPEPLIPVAEGREDLFARKQLGYEMPTGVGATDSEGLWGLPAMIVNFFFE